MARRARAGRRRRACRPRAHTRGSRRQAPPGRRTSCRAPLRSPCTREGTGATGGDIVAPMADPIVITVLEGDQTGQELLEQSLRVLDAELLGVELSLERFDLSLEKRRETSNEIVHEAARAMKASELGLKAATVTPEGAG